MNIYIDESGAISPHFANNNFFVIALIHVYNKSALERAYKRFVSSNYARLLELDSKKNAKPCKSGSKMFINGKFKELKGAQFDPDMKKTFLSFFSQKHLFDVYYIKLENNKLPDAFRSAPARTFNYAVRFSLQMLIQNGYLPNEDCVLQPDERNEKIENRVFLENYLNTELVLNGTASGHFFVRYFDSECNKFIKIADVFANLYYSQMQSGRYSKEFNALKNSGILRYILEIPASF